MKKAVCLILCFMLMILPLSAVETESAEGIKAPSAVLMGTQGEVLLEKNAHEKRPIASVTKVMTLLLVFEAIDEGSLSLTDTITASGHACSMDGSQIWLEEGEQLTVEEMIKAVVICSANDCAVALAEHIGGTEEAFVARMNERAQELGLSETHFENACGLTAEGHLSSAYDVAVMSCELVKHEKVCEYAVIWQDTLRDGEFVMTNTNKLIRNYSGMTGLKTGFTSDAGYCLSATAERDGLALCAVVLGAASIDARSADIVSLLNYGFATFASVTPTPDRPLMPIKVELGKSEYVPVRLADSSPITIKRSDGKKIVKTVELEESLKAPVAKGQQVGTMIVSLEDREIARIPVLASNDVLRLGVFGIMKKMLKMAFMK